MRVDLLRYFVKDLCFLQYRKLFCMFLTVVDEVVQARQLLWIGDRPEGVRTEMEITVARVGTVPANCMGCDGAA